jgi:monofunctional chorismate mutase
MFQEELESLRAHIDAIDNELLNALARRVEVSTAIGRLKLANGLTVLDATREIKMIGERGAAAANLNLPQNWVMNLFREIVSECRAISRERLAVSGE